MSILDEIFEGRYEPHERHVTVEYKEEREKLQAEIAPLLAEAERAAGRELIDRLLSLNTAQCAIEDVETFRAGFLLGARLILEIIPPQ